MKNQRLSEHFVQEEFPIKDNGIVVGYVTPHKMLLTVLERLHYLTKAKAINILSAGRTAKDHIRVYKKNEARGYYNGKRWFEVIKWGSYHLPRFNTPDLLGCDLNVLLQDGSYMSGEDILKYLIQIEEEMQISLGKGIASKSVHIDIRKTAAMWRYPF